MALLDPKYLEAIKGFEGYSPASKWDYKQYSSGYGTKAQPGEVIDRATAEQRFNDAVQKAAAHVDSVNPNLPAGARAALISLTYNAGPGWSQSGLGGLVRAGDLQGAQARLLEYNKAGGEVNKGLVNRRTAEAGWFGPPVSPQAQAAPQQPASQPLPTSPASPPQAIPQQAAPIFSQASAPAQPMQFQPIELAPMQLRPPPRRPIDLSRLRAALQQGPHSGAFSLRG